MDEKSNNSYKTKAEEKVSEHLGEQNYEMKGYIKEIENSPKLQIAVLLFFGLLFRLYDFKFTYIINEDGVFYINQAKAIFHGEWELARSCGFKFISLYHVLIPIAYKILGDWVIAAKSVSLFFGTAAVIIFYLLLRHFFSVQTAFLGSLAFAVNPFFVEYSVAIVKGPIYWSFALLGILFFVAAYNAGNKDYLLVLSNLSFLVAGFARFEILIYVIGSSIYTMFVGKKKLRRALIFNLPIIAGVTIILAVMLFRSNANLWELYLAPRILHFYYIVTSSIFSSLFLERLIRGLGILIIKTSKSIYVPFLLIILAGFWNMRRELVRNYHIRLLLLLSLLSCCALMLFYIKTGILSGRYTVLVVLPLFAFIGPGIEVISDFFAKRNVRQRTVVIVLSLIMIALTLFPNLKHRRPEKVIFKTIGEFIAERENDRSAIVAGPDVRIMFYANVESNDITCNNEVTLNYEKLTGLDYPELIKTLKNNAVQYLIWKENLEEKSVQRFPGLSDRGNFEIVKRWHFRDHRFIALKML